MYLQLESDKLRLKLHEGVTQYFIFIFLIREMSESKLARSFNMLNHLNFKKQKTKEALMYTSNFEFV